MEPTFVLPRAREYPFDEVCTQIVEALFHRNFLVEGVTVRMGQYRNTKSAWKFVESIMIPDLDIELEFSRKQGNFDYDRYDTSSVDTLMLPGKVLQVYADYSGPTYYMYVGRNWDTDKEQFFHGLHVNSKLNGDPRIYIKYKGASRPDGHASYTHQMNPFLVYDSDLGREHELWHGDKDLYATTTVMENIATSLKKALNFVRRAPGVSNRSVDTRPVGRSWSGAMTLENSEAIYNQLHILLSGKTYTFDDGWSSRQPREETSKGISYAESRYGTYITITDTYGSWGFHAGPTTLLTFSRTFGQNNIEVQQEAPNGNELTWTIVVPD